MAAEEASLEKKEEVEEENLEFKWGKKRGIGGKKKDVQFYDSFTYDGVEYNLFDDVFLHKEGESEPYIGKLIKIWEYRHSSKKVKVQWFFRPREIRNFLQGIDPPRADELFLACGDGPGLANVNPLEAVAGKCNIICISKDTRNRQPSDEELKMADFVFYRFFDVGHRKILDNIDDKNAGIDDMTNISEHHHFDELEILPREYPDYSEHFKTSEIFAHRDDILNWVRGVGYSIGFVLVVYRSDEARNGRRGRITMACEKSGTYKAYKDVLKLKTSTKKSQCPFLLYAKEGPNGWTISVKCGQHNHDSIKSFVGHPYPGRLTEQERAKVELLKLNSVKPRSILNSLKLDNPSNCTTIGQIYDFGAKFKRSVRHPRTQMQHLLKLLKDDGYFTLHRSDDETDVVKDIFWAHPTAVKLLNKFSIVLIFDTTYKTNKYRLPLLEIIGQTSTEMSFTAAFCYMECEKHSNYLWALQQLRALIDDVSHPSVIVTDNEAALVGAIENVFPSTCHLLCQFHINKNVRSYARKCLHKLDLVNPIMDAWCDVVQSPNEDHYISNVTAFESACSGCPALIEYVQRIHLKSNKEKFVHAWTNNVMHLGNTTSNRAESSHASLQSMLSAQGCLGDLCTAFESMGKMLRIQHTSIQESFEISITNVDHRVNKSFFKDVRGFVSREALLYVTRDLETIIKGLPCGFCDCTVKRTHGLPCKCELDAIIQSGRCLPIHVFHHHWRQLSFEQNDKCDDDYDPQPLVDEFYRQLSISDNIGKKVLYNKFHQILYPETSSLIPPNQKVKTKGRPSSRSSKRSLSGWEHQDIASDKVVDTQMSEAYNQQPRQEPVKKVKCMSPYMQQLPLIYHEFVKGVVDVEKDGNCGYRTLSMYKFENEDHYILIRHELLTEMTQNKDWYIYVFGVSRYEDVKTSLFVNRLGSVPQQKWMSLPDMGLVICNRYNVALVSLGDTELKCATYLPTRLAPPVDPKIWVIGYVDNCHWVQVLLNNTSPLPDIQCQWKHLSSEEAAEWESVINGRRRFI